MTSTPQRKHLQTWREVADYIGVSVKTAQAYRRNAGLPVSKIGNRIYALPERIDGWIAEHEELLAQVA